MTAHLVSADFWHTTASFPWIGKTARALATTLPNSELVELPDQPHSPAPDVLAPQLIRFFTT